MSPRRTNADGGTTSYGYDAALNLTSVTGPLGEQVQLAYDAAGYLIKAVAPSGATRQWARDDANRVTSYTAQDGTVIEFRYSAAGQLVERIDPGGRRSATATTRRATAPASPMPWATRSRTATTRWEN